MVKTPVNPINSLIGQIREAIESGHLQEPFTVQEIKGLVERLEAQESLKDQTALLEEENQDHSIVVERLKLATASSQLGIWDWNVIENTMTWDDRTLELYGYTMNTLPAGIEAWQQRLHPEEREVILAECQAALNGAKEWDIEFRVVHPDGTVKHIKANGSVLRDKDGTALQMFGVNSDITERKKAEQTLQYERDLSLDIINTQPAGIYRIRVLATETWETNAWRNSKSSPVVVELASEPFCEILNTTKEAFENNPGMMIDLIYPDDREGFAKKNEDAVFLEDFNWEGRLFIDDVIKWVRFDSLPRPLENGDILWTGALTDITERKQMEVEREKLITQLQDKTAEQERFIYTASHDLKSPLVTISGFAQMIEQDLHSGNQAGLKENLTFILNAAQRMKQLLDDLLEISRHGIKRNSEEVVNLGTLISEAVKNLFGLIKEYNTTLEV